MYITGGYMKTEKMNKNQLIQSIQICDKNLNNPLWVRRNTEFRIGVIVNHRAKLIARLITIGGKYV